MNLVFLYGPPAVGKLTIAQELSKLTGYKLFHNHLSVDLAASVFPYDSKEFYKLLDKIRIETFEQAANANIKGIIFTFVYAAEEDDYFVNKVNKVINKYKGNLYLTRLFCNKDILEKRVENKSREAFRKTMSREVLNKILEKYDVFSDVKGYKSLVIDTGKSLPKESAEKIIQHYQLNYKD